MALRGMRLRPLRPVDGERRLLVACILQALQDARRGDGEAWRWLETTGRQWCELLDIDGVDDWQAAAERIPDCRRELSAVMDRAEYMRRWYLRRKEQGARPGD